MSGQLIPHSHVNSSMGNEAETISAENSYAKAVSRLGEFLQRVVNALFYSPELQIWQKNDRNGNVYWYAHDPITGRIVCKYSENDMRIWIEKLRQK